MNKRQFLGSAALAAALPASAAACATGPALLTVTGAIKHSNRGPFDPGRDILMGKHQLRFERAWSLTAAAIAGMPAVRIRPTLEYDGKPHTLQGPLLLDALAPASGRLADSARLVLRALDGYAVTLTAAQLRAQRFILATHMDGAPLALGGLGPLWAVLDADRVEELRGKPVSERFGACPWGLYHIEVQA